MKQSRFRLRSSGVAVIVAGLSVWSGLAGGLTFSPNGPALDSVPGFSWDDRFGFPGVNGRVLAVAVWNGALYIGGEFTEAGGIPANKLARWDGRTWAEVGGGVSTGGTPGPIINSLVATPEGLYVGGFFRDVGSASANNIARWDGAQWHALAAGVGNEVFAIAVDGADVYAGGNFRTASGVEALRVTRWNGVAWSALGAGFGTAFDDNAIVRALYVYETEIYAGGEFSVSGGVPIENVARWDGASWSELGLGVDGPVHALARYGDDLYVGGQYTMAGTTEILNLARWTDTGWETAGGLVNGSVYSLITDGLTLCAGGDFSVAGGVSALRTVRYDGQAWEEMGSGASGSVRALARASDGTVYAGGDFGSAGLRSAQKIAAFTGEDWFPLGLGVEGKVRVVLSAHGGFYVGGNFLFSGGVFSNSIAFWDGSEWSSLGSGIGGEVFALAVDGNRLYVGGSFLIAGGTIASNVAVWDGGEWSALDAGLDGTCRALAVGQTGLLYAGGSFTNAGGISAQGVAGWDGNNWFPLGSGIPPVFQVKDLVVLGTEVFAGGFFSMAGTVEAANIARWDGLSWSALGQGMNGQVQALAVDRGRVYAAGDFTTAGGNGSDGIAYWEGGAWTSIPAGFDRQVLFSLAVRSDTVFVGGDFTAIGEAPVRSLAMWNGQSWLDLAGGINGVVEAVALDHTAVAVGGTFSGAGSETGFNFSIGEFGGMVPVRLLSFTAMRVPGAAEIRWEVASRTSDHEGFRVYREDPSANRVPVDASVLGGPEMFLLRDPNPPSSEVRYWLAERDRSGRVEWHGPTVLAPQRVSSIPRLTQNHPNPFRASTEIRFEAGGVERVDLAVFDVRGRRLRTLWNRVPEPGPHRVVWDGRDDAGDVVAGGLYFYRLKSGERTTVRKMLLLR